MSIFDNIRTTHNPNEKGVVLTEEESVEFLNSLNASMVEKNTIVLNPEESDRLDYKANWEDLVSFEDYLAIKAQKAVFESNQKGYESNNSCR